MTFRTAPLLATGLMLAAARLHAQTPPPPPAIPGPLTAAQEAHYMELGRKYTRWFLNGNADSLAAVTDSAMLANGGGKALLVDKINQVALRAGNETKVLVEKMTRRHGIPQFWHEADFAQLTGEPLVIRWLMDADGRIIGLGLGLKGQTPAPDEP